MPRPLCYGLVTVDVEPDNVWSAPAGTGFSNIAALPRFQQLCAEYGVRPTYLVTYSVAEHAPSARVIEQLLRDGCEIGAHPHMWETPPLLVSDAAQTLPANQYPTDALTKKLETITATLRARFGTITSHRAGRWGFDQRQASVLARLGYIVDSSVTPGLDWSSTGAPDYSDAQPEPYVIPQDGPALLEVPCTVRPGVRLAGLERTRYGGGLLRRLKLAPAWLRCEPQVGARQLLEICEWGAEHMPHLNLMTHSSELCAGASPMWKSEVDIERHLGCYREVFAWWCEHEIRPVTLSEFARIFSGNTGSGEAMRSNAGR